VIKHPIILMNTTFKVGDSVSTIKNPERCMGIRLIDGEHISCYWKDANGTQHTEKFHVDELKLYQLKRGDIHMIKTRDNRY